jgi:protein TonB
VPAPDASSHANQPAPSSPQAQAKPQAESSPVATPVSPQTDRSRDAAPAPETKPNTVAKASTDSAPPGAIDRFTREIERAGSQVFDQRDYPSEAKDKKWQGTTLIEVRYAEGGYIRSIVVGKSSGHPVLDEQALQIARNLRLPNAPEELRSHEFAVRFPIVFQLSRP